MKYKLQLRKNPQDQEAPAKYYAAPVWDGIVGLDYVARRIAGRSSLTVGDVENVLRNFLDELPHLMLLGKAVDLSGFGIFRVSFSSDGVTKAEDFRATMMRHPRVLFRASMQMKAQVEEGITYEKTTEKTT